MDTDNFNSLIDKAVKVLSDDLPSEKYPSSVYFDIPGTKNGGQIRVTKNLNAKDRFYIQTMSIRNGTDRAISNYLFEGTIHDIKARLLTSEGKEEIKSSLMNLSQKVDDYYD